MPPFQSGRHPTVCCVYRGAVVFDIDSEEDEVGEIVKHWGGCRDIFGGANDFSLKFFSDMDVMKKMLLFGSTFLIDFNYFEYKRNKLNHHTFRHQTYFNNLDY